MSAPPGSSGPGPARRPGAGPFKFLDYYTQEDESLFAGRDREVRRVAAELLQGRAYVLYGRSGIGKTSFLLAGLFPVLSRRGYRPVYVRMLTAPLADLHRAVALKAGAGGEEDQDLRALLARLSAEEPVILVLDQFEEFFIRFRAQPERRRKLIEDLARLLADPGLDLRVLFSLRQDYLGEMDDLRDVIPHLFEHELRLRSLSAFGARRSIANQLEAAGVRYEQQFLLRVVDELDAYDFDPTVLQIVCSEVYRRAEARSPGEVRLAAGDLEAIGSLRDLFLTFLGQLSADLPERLQLTARTVLDSLITREHTKQAVTPADFETAAFQAAPEDLEEVLESLVDHRLVRRGQRGQTVWYELIHERLVSVIREWLDQDEEFLKLSLARNLIDNMSHGEGWRDQPEALAAPGQLALVHPFREWFCLSEAEIEFLFRSAVYRCVGDAVPYWGERLGRERSVELLGELLAAEEPEVRRSAAWAVRHLPEPPLVSACTRLALQDGDPGVRRAARETVAKRGGSEECEELKRALASKETRKAAFEGLVSLYRAGSPLPRLPLWRRWRLARAARRTVAREHADELRRCGRLGALQGMLAGMAWVVVVGVPVVHLTAWSSGLRGTGAGGLEWGVVAPLGIALPVIAGLGALLGWRLAVVTSREWVLRPGLSWFRAVVRGGPLPLVAILVLPVVTMLGLELLSPRMEPEGPLAGCAILVSLLLLAYLFARLLTLPIAALAHLSSWVLRPGGSTGEAWRWSLVAAAGFSLLLPFLITSVVILVEPGLNGEGLSLLGVEVGAFLSLFVFQAGRILDAVDFPPDRPTPHRPAWVRWTRTAAALSVAAVLAAYLVGVGLDTVPITRMARDIGPGSDFVLSDCLGPGYPDTDYYQLRSTERLTVLRLAEGPDPGQVPLRVADEHLLERNAVFMPEETTAWLRVGPVEGEASSVAYELDIEAPPILDLGEPLRLTEGEWSFASVELPVVDPTEPALGRRTLALSGQLSGASGEEGQGVEVFFPRNHPIATGSEMGDSDLLVFDFADTLSIRFEPGVAVNDLPGEEGASHRTTYAVEIREGGEWSLTAFLRWPGPSGDRQGRAAAAPGVPLVGIQRGSTAASRTHESTVSMVVGFRLTSQVTPRADRIADLAREGGQARRYDEGGLWYEQAAAWAAKTDDSLANHQLCWWGSLWEFAGAVVPACDRAVELAPGDDLTTETLTHDSRAVNRALRGELASAAEDLQFVLEREGRVDHSPEWFEERRSWFEVLEGGESPFDEDTLRKLRSRRVWDHPAVPGRSGRSG